jgi:ubiquinone/menaquinone biosynthesis C-methylase UbiE
MPKNPVTIAAHAKDYFTRNAAVYVTSTTHADAAVLGRLAALAQVPAQGRVLDVATGAGHTALALAEGTGMTIATDLTRAMLLEARALAARRGVETLRLVECDAHALPFADGHFDVVTCRRAAHHFAHIALALREFCRVLRPGGRLIIDDRSVPENDVTDELMQRLDTLHDPSHVRQYRASEWEAMLAEAGFRIEQVEPYTQSRPLSAFTTGARPEDAAAVRAIFAGLDAAGRRRLGVREKEGETFSTHWYILLSALK